MTSSSDSAIGTPGDDSHGNTVSDGNQSLAYDIANREVSQSGGGTTVSYVRDATDRVVPAR